MFTVLLSLSDGDGFADPLLINVFPASPAAAAVLPPQHPHHDKNGSIWPFSQAVGGGGWQ